MGEKSSYTTDFFMDNIWAGYEQTLKRKRTKANYFSFIRCLCEYTKSDFTQINEKQAVSYFESRRMESPHPTAKTMHTWLSCYRGVGRYIMDHASSLPGLEDYRSPFESVYLPDYSDDIRLEDLPSDTELTRIMETAAAMPDQGQMYLMVLFATKCAMTAGEIRSLTPKKIQMDAAGRGFVVFKDKQKIHNRIVKVPDVIMRYLGAHEDVFSNREALFLNATGGLLSERSMQNYVRRLMEEAGVRKSYTIQDLRNLSITKMLFYGATEEETASYVGIEPGWMYRYSRILPELDHAPCDLL